MIVHPIQNRSGRFSFRSFQALAGDRLPSVLASRLDDAYHYFHDVRAGIGPALDAVVVGPGGTWALSRTDLHGRFRKRNGHWYRWNHSTESWVPWDSRPVTDARMAGHRLELLLERAGLPAAVEACLLVGGGGDVDWEKDQTPGIHVHRDSDALARRIGRDEVLTPAQVDRIVALLDPRQPLPQLAASTPRG